MHSTPPRRPWRAPLALALLLTVSACAGDDHSRDSGQDDLSADATSDADTPVNFDACAPNLELFEAAVWPTMGTTCFICHGADGPGAQRSDLDLIAVNTPADLEANLATLLTVAGQQEDGTSVVLLKPLGELEHGGGTLLDADSVTFTALSELVARLNDESDCAPDSDLAALELHVNAAALPVGRVLPFSLIARSAAGDVLERPDDLVVSTSDEAIAVVESGDRVRGLAEGRVTLLATAGDVTSDPLTLDVIPNEAYGTSELRLLTPRVVLEPGQRAPLEVEVRDADGARVLAPEVSWTTGDAQVARVDAAGLLTAEALGVTEVWASFEGADSARVPVLVTDAPDHLAVDIVSPSSDTSAHATLMVEVDVQWMLTGSPSDFGAPAAASRVEVFAGERSLGVLTRDFFGAAGALDLSALPDGPVRLVAEAEVDGQLARSAPLTLYKTRAPAPIWDDLGAPDAPTWETVYGQRAHTWFVGDDLYSAVNVCGRECSLRLFRHDGPDAGDWNPVAYTQRHFRSLSGALEEQIVTRDNIDLAHYVGWGWISTRAREAHTLPASDEIIVAWSNEDARSSFNLEGAPASYWNDCYVARWDATAGYDGLGGWRLLSTEDPTWQDEPPHPDALPEDAAEAHFPAGLDAVRVEDCSHPKLALVDGEPLVAYVATPIPNNDWKLRLRRWSGDAWQDAGPTLALGANAVLHDMVLDDAGRPVIAVDHDGHTGRVLRLEQGAWKPLGAAPPTRALRLRDDGALIAASLDQGDASIHAHDGARWSPLGPQLDASGWAQVQEIGLFIDGDRLAVAWAEGPTHGAWNVHAAVWRPATGAWEQPGDGPYELDPDADAADPQVLIDASGHLIVRYAEPNPAADNDARTWIQRARRSQSPVF